MAEAKHTYSIELTSSEFETLFAACGIYADSTTNLEERKTITAVVKKIADARTAVVRDTLKGKLSKPKADLVKGMKCGKVDMYPRDELIAYYEQGVAMCEGSERDRYCDVLGALMGGSTDITSLVS